MDKNGWVETNDALAQIAPSDTELKNFLNDKAIYVT